MVQAHSKKPPADLPDENTFWRRYSPHHECLLSTVASVTCHGLVLGVLILSGLVSISWGRSESARPPNMDVVQLPAGDGFDGGGGGGDPAPLGTPAEAILAKTNEAKTLAQKLPEFQDIKTPLLNVPDAPLLEPGDAADPFQELARSLKEVGKEPVKKDKTKVVGTVGDQKGVPGGKGSGGSGGGDGVGPNTGKKGRFGVPRGATRQEILARKWRFDMSGDGKEHADKLAAIGVILAVPDANGNPLFIRDLKRRPVQARPGDISKFKDAVRWNNYKPDSVFILARELQLPFVPKFVAMYLPRDREEKMAEAEKRFAQRLSRPLENVTATWFDFQLRNGVYEPVVIRQE
ncbi:MAG: hypothetical protein FJ271_24535 [Planctomycetes bacterium]|nr:hypothetical protein [Planctomycetota bacterium]